MRERFPRRNDSNLRRPNDNRTDKSQRDYSGPSRKPKPDDLVAAVDRLSRGKPGGGKKNKPADKEHEEDDQGDKSHSEKFQDTSKTVNVIFGGDGDFDSRREQKLLLREIMSVEPVVPRPLCWSEVPISFSRDDQWTSFSEPGKFPLVLDPVVAEVSLTKVLMTAGVVSTSSSLAL
jgi:hypothetical protein